MASPKSLNKKAREAMRASVVDGWRRGKSHAAIAAELGITREGVHYWITKIRKEVAHSIGDRAALIEEHAEALRYIRDEAIGAWTKSREARETKLTEQTVDDGPVRVGPDGKPKGGGGKGNKMRAQVVTEETAGEAVFLAQARGALADERELLGLDAPKKTSLTDPSGSGELSLRVILEKAKGSDD